jgi:hypothetical protein
MSPMLRAERRLGNEVHQAARLAASHRRRGRALHILDAIIEAAVAVHGEGRDVAVHIGVGDLDSADIHDFRLVRVGAGLDVGHVFGEFATVEDEGVVEELRGHDADGLRHIDVAQIEPRR